MRYSTEPRKTKYYEICFCFCFFFLSFSRLFSNKYGKKLVVTPTKTGIDAAKISSKTVVQKTVETTGDLIGIK